ncbi:MAG: hypothetical protein ACR2J5_06245 [Geodermatophilaceae bacterium]
MDVDIERELVRQAALDYFEGWYDADAVRMEGALHNELAKRSFVNDGGGALGVR